MFLCCTYQDSNKQPRTPKILDYISYNHFKVATLTMPGKEVRFKRTGDLKIAYLYLGNRKEQSKPTLHSVNQHFTLRLTLEKGSCHNSAKKKNTTLPSSLFFFSPTQLRVLCWFYRASGSAMIATCQNFSLSSFPSLIWNPNACSSPLIYPLLTYQMQDQFY